MLGIYVAWTKDALIIYHIHNLWKTENHIVVNKICPVPAEIISKRGLPDEMRKIPNLHIIPIGYTQMLH